MITIPGLVDFRTHVDTAGENWASTSAAALAGGFTTIVADGAGQTPLTSNAVLNQSLSQAAASSKCDFAQLALATGENARELTNFFPDAAGICLYAENTAHPDLAITNMHQTNRIFSDFPPDKPILVYGNSQQIGATIFSASMHHKKIHICDVRTWDQLEVILEARNSGLQVTCDVSATTLFLSQKHIASAPAPVRAMLPQLGSEDDRLAIWHHLDAIDCFATGHHPQPEGTGSGFPALETAIRLYFYAIEGGFLTIEDVLTRCYSNPMRIFNLKPQPDTFVEIDPDLRAKIDPAAFHSVNKRSPFAGLEFPGIIQKVTLRGTVVYEHNDVLVPDGSGQAALKLRPE